MNIKEEIIKALSTVSGVNVGEIKLEKPENEDFGDYSSNIAMIIFAKFQETSSKKQTNSKSQNLKFQASKTPRELAQEIVKQLETDNEITKIADRITTAGPGFINFHLKKEILLDTLLYISSHKDIVRHSAKNIGKKVIVEYSSPNIAKPFTIGHLRSTIIGDCIANLFEATGWEVYRDNHIGDWGTQFGKQIYAIKTWGNIEEIEKSDNPVRELVALYVKFHEEAEKDPGLDDNAREWFKRLENGDREARELWQKCIDLSWREFDKIYKILDVSFSKEFGNGRGLGESFFEDKMEPVIKDLEKNNLLKVGEEGARLVFFENEKYPSAMILKKDGATLYHTRDLATDKYRKENYNPDRIVNEVGVEQTLYFQQLFEIERMLGWFNKEERVHVPHGLYRFKDKKMSTRKGDVIWLEEVLFEAIERAKKLGSESDELAGVVAIGALKYNDLKRDSKTEISFDWDEILNMEGNSGPYLQYTYARTESIIQKSHLASKGLALQGYEVTKEELSLLRAFIHFSEVVEEAAEKYSPNLLCNYLFDLAQKYNSFYNAHKIVGSEQEKFRVLLTKGTGQILKTGLNLLGIKAPDKM